MASVHKKTRGGYEVRFFVGDDRRSFYPGSSCTRKQATSIGVKLDKLAFAVSQSESPSLDVAEWLVTLSKRQHDRLASWGLVQRRAEPSDAILLADWLDLYIERGNRKEATKKQLRFAKSNMTTFFDGDKPISEITSADAEDYRIWLETKARVVGEDKKPRGLAKNTVRRRMGRAREFFNLAVRRGIIAKNPFADEAVSVSGNPERQFFVPSDWVEKCIKVANCEDWRIMLAFARYAGMRSHETRLQRWEDIDIPNRSMIVRSTKTPPERVCPIFPELLPHLIRAKEMAPGGAELVVSRYTPDQNIGETIKKIIKRAGLTVWPRPIQNLRATRETELIAEYPIKDVASWLGNSAPIAMKHYAMTMKSSFERAIQSGAGGVQKMSPHNSPHATATTSAQQQSGDSDDHPEANKTVVLSAIDCHDESLPMPRAGLEPA